MKFGAYAENYIYITYLEGVLFENSSLTLIMTQCDMREHFKFLRHIFFNLVLGIKAILFMQCEILVKRH